MAGKEKYMIIVEGIMSIQSGENPKSLRDKLLTFVDQKQRGGESGGKGRKFERKDKANTLAHIHLLRRRKRDKRMVQNNKHSRHTA